MLRDHKEKIEDIVEMHEKIKIVDAKEKQTITIRDLEFGDSIYNSMNSLSKETLDYIQTIYYIGRRYEEFQVEESPKDIFEKYFSYVKSFSEDKKAQLDYLSYKTNLLECMKKGIDYIGWDIDFN